MGRRGRGKEAGREEESGEGGRKEGGETEGERKARLPRWARGVTCWMIQSFEPRA